MAGCPEMLRGARAGAGRGCSSRAEPGGRWNRPPTSLHDRSSNMTAPPGQRLAEAGRDGLVRGAATRRRRRSRSSPGRDRAAALRRGARIRGVACACIRWCMSISERPMRIDQDRVMRPMRRCATHPVVGGERARSDPGLPCPAQRRGAGHYLYRILNRPARPPSIAGGSGTLRQRI